MQDITEDVVRNQGLLETLLHVITDSLMEGLPDDEEMTTVNVEHILLRSQSLPPLTSCTVCPQKLHVSNCVLWDSQLCRHCASNPSHTGESAPSVSTTTVACVVQITASRGPIDWLALTQHQLAQRSSCVGVLTPGARTTVLPFLTR